MTSPQDQITAFLSGKGLTAAQIAGVEGNLQVESGFRSTAVNPKEGAIGLAQWEGGRRTNLQAFARNAGTTETDINAQLGFMWSELQGSEHSALTALLATTTPAAAATAFDQKYERSSAASLPTRVQNAQNIAASGLKGGSGNVATGGATGSNSANGSNAGLFSMPSLGDLFGGLVVPGYGALAGSGLDAQSMAAAGMTQIGHWLIDGLLILVGVALVIFALSTIAKGGQGAPATAAPSRAEDAAVLA